MARTPSMSVAEAEAAIGSRGFVTVSAENRGTVRKWFSAQGMPSLFVGGLSMRELQLAYNDTSGEQYGRLLRKLEEARENGADVDGEEAPAVNGKAPLPFVNGDAASQLAALIASIAGAQLDESKVREIARHEAAQVAPRPIEVRIDDKPPVRIAGHVSPQFDRVLKLVAGGANVLLVGPAGCGKTHMAEQIAKALGATYGAIHGSAGASESALTGWLLPGDGGNFEYVPSPFVSLYEQGESLFLCDELDAFDPNMLIVMNGALANGHMHVAHRKGKPCVTRGRNARIMATANTYGTGANPMYAGRSQLDGATLDRFIIVTVDYDRNLESEIGRAGGLDASEMADLWSLRDKVRTNALRRIVSTRSFQKAVIMKAAGDSWATVKATLVEGWSRDERAKVGM